MQDNSCDQRNASVHVTTGWNKPCTSETINNLYSHVYHSATGTLNSESVFAFSSGSAGLIRTVV